MNTKINNIYRSLKENLSAKMGEGGASASAYLLIEHIYNITRNEVVVFGDREVLQDISKEQECVNLLLEDMPIDYIVAKREFYGRSFNVSDAVLIPRPETEELVRLIISEWATCSPSIVDIGSGSGVISLTLALEMPNSSVTAIDISSKALDVARRNSEKFQIENISFIEQDILALASFDSKFDIIVSNPPYVTNSEKVLMSDNVLCYEPHLALFVDDDEPLIFYEKIATLALTSLNDGGVLYFEINERFGGELCEMLHTKGFGDVQLINDLFDKPRIIRAKR